MRGEADFVAGIQNLRRAYDYWQSFIRDRPGTRGDKLFSQYCKKMEWIIQDLGSNPLFPDIVRDNIRKEWHADQFTSPAIVDKIALLSPEQREVIEEVIETVIRGEHVRIEVEPENIKS